LDLNLFVSCFSTDLQGFFGDLLPSTSFNIHILIQKNPNTAPVNPPKWTNITDFVLYPTGFCGPSAVLSFRLLSSVDKNKYRIHNKLTICIDCCLKIYSVKHFPQNEAKQVHYCRLPSNLSHYCLLRFFCILLFILLSGLYHFDLLIRPIINGINCLKHYLKKHKSFYYDTCTTF
jgi:hypothetical protein